ncbi:MAG: hypothetical protein QW840_01295 [Candidatus Bathyarchaeia archaeon]
MCGASVQTWDVEQPYERKFSVFQRLYKLFLKPSEAMRDIAGTPDYRGVLVIMIIQGVLWLLSALMLLLKLQFVGGYSGEMNTLVSFLAAAVLFFPMPVTLGIKWAAKSLVVKYACASKSDWDFETAASVTGYAYIADVIVTLAGVVAAWFLIPSRTIEVWDMDRAMGVIGWWQFTTRSLKLSVLLPVTIFGLIWKGFLGGLGIHHGTNRKCSLLKGTLVFTLLGVFSLLFGSSSI